MHIGQLPKHQISICILASGSKGNSVYVSDGITSLLIDAGLSGAEMKKRFESRGLALENLDAVLVTHEHSDHVQGVGVLSRRYRLPVYMNPKTFHASAFKIGKLHETRTFRCGTDFTLNSFTIRPFSVSHDASDTSGFTIHFNGAKIGIATDLGIATNMVKDRLTGCDVLILEANHDPEMLITGPYSWPLKQRVKGRTGHLANFETRALLDELKHGGLAHVILAHMSETNNTPEKALNEIAPVFNESSTQVSVACQDEAGRILKI